MTASTETGGEQDLGGRAGAYREMRPPEHLAADVECFWHRGAGGTPGPARILPDGCIDIIWVSGHEPFVAGPATLPVCAALDGRAEVVGVRFRPGVGGRVLGLDAQDVRDRHAALRDIWPRGRAAAFARAVERPTLAAKIEAVGGSIAERLESAPDADPLVREAVAWIAGRPHGNIEEMARRSGLSDRQMRRRFAQAVGYGPKLLQRVLRMQRVLWLMQRGADDVPGLAGLALAAGYADQAHMTRELVELGGATPRQLRLDAGRGSAVSELFKTVSGRDATMAP